MPDYAAAYPSPVPQARLENLPMRLALFVPCYVDQLRPRIGLAALELLEFAGFDVEAPSDIACCGQPFLTAGEADHAHSFGERFAARFDEFDAIVAPSASCVATLRSHLTPTSEGGEPNGLRERVASKTFEFSEFLESRWDSPSLQHPYPKRVGLHSSCHALRGLRLGTPSETRDAPRPDPAAQLLDQIPELERIDLARWDECCGFGGVFSIEEEAVSVRMGLDRLADHQRGRAEVLTSTDVSCLLHMQGLARRRNTPLHFLHLAEILAASAFGEDWLTANDELGEAGHGAR